MALPIDVNRGSFSSSTFFFVVLRVYDVVVRIFLRALPYSDNICLFFFIHLTFETAMNLTQLLDTFQLIDKNKDGSISFDEVNQI